jgi:hypothetical protein
VLKVEGVSFWGLAFTNTYLLGDPMARVVETEFENGDRSRVTDWFSNTAIERSSELISNAMATPRSGG